MARKGHQRGGRALTRIPQGRGELQDLLTARLDEVKLLVTGEGQGPGVEEARF